MVEGDARGCPPEPSTPADAIAQAVVDERRRLARELHDGPVQSLWFIGAEIRRLRKLAGDAPSELSNGLQALQATWAHVYDELRHTIGDLHHPLPAENGLVHMLEQTLARLKCERGLVTEFHVDLDVAPCPLDRATEAQLIRICQAALTNVQRHAAARHVRVALRADAACVVLTVEDDGVGFDPVAVGQQATHHYGLAMMRERAEALGGHIEVVSQPGQGTRLQVCVPARAE